MSLKNLLSIRLIGSVLVLVAGGGLVCYGLSYHEQKVVTVVEKEVTPPDPFADMQMSGPPGMGPDMPPPPPMEKETILIEESEIEPESVLVREVTVGGLMLNPDGVLERTYTGAPPAFCPT